jgi:integrase
MTTKKISKKSVDALKCPPDKDREFMWDSDLKGFGVVAMPSGRKVYIAKYRHGKQVRRMKLGKHDPLTPDEARQRAKEVLGDVARDKDPLEERRAKRAEQPFRKLAEGYMQLHVAIKCKSRTNEEYGRLLRLHILPALGSKSAGQVRKADVARLHGAMAKTPAAANRCVALIDSIWNFSVDSGEIGALPSPTKDLELYPEEDRDRYLTVEEMRRLGKAMHLAETTGLPWVVDDKGPKSKHLAKPENRSRVVDPHAVAAIRLLILTGSRLREILNARWDWLDVERGILFLPDSKRGKKPVYLSAMALEILDEIPRLQGNPHVFPGAKEGTHRADLKRPWTAIRRYAGLEADDAPRKGDKASRSKAVSRGRPAVRIHDLRHSFASVGVGSSMGLPIIGKLLGHRQVRSTNRYAHLDSDPVRKSANLIGTQIVAALTHRGEADE